MWVSNDCPVERHQRGVSRIQKVSVYYFILDSINADINPNNTDQIAENVIAILKQNRIMHKNVDKKERTGFVDARGYTEAVSV